MTAQLALCFDEVPLTDKTQARYHAIAPCLACRLSAIEQARHLNLSYQKVTRWLRDFHQRGMPGLFSVALQSLFRGARNQQALFSTQRSRRVKSAATNFA